MFNIDFYYKIWYYKSWNGESDLVNNNIYIIEEQSIESAKFSCEIIEDANIRAQAVANSLSVDIATKFFNNKDVEIDSVINTIPAILEEANINDIYVENNYIDIRIFFEDNELCIPKSHFTFGIRPTAYMFIKFSQDATNASVEGFITPDKVNTLQETEEFYIVSKDDLQTYQEIEFLINYKADNPISDDFKTLIFEYIDNNLTFEQKKDFYSELVQNREARFLLKQAFELDNITNFVSQETDLDYNLEATSSDFYEEEHNLEDFSTNTTPSIDDIENSDEIFEQLVEESFEENDLVEEELNYYEDDSESETTQNVTQEAPEIEEKELNELFDNQNSLEDTDNDFEIEPVAKKKSSFIPILGVLAVIGALGFWGYSKFNQDNISTVVTKPINKTIEAPTVDVGEQKDATPVKPATTEAMPNETVENVKPINKEEGLAVSIPQIEQNLDASIRVSNLSVSWEIPAKSANNPAVGKYLTKLGKIIQLNLKTELMLLSKPPITNKIVLDIAYNKKNSSFTIKDIRISSGEKTVDTVIKQTVGKMLDLDLKVNSMANENMPENISLIIKL